VTITGHQGDTFTFSVPWGSEHRLEVDDVNTDSITGTFFSDPVEFTITKGESQEFDITGDGINDVVITLDEADGSSREFTATMQLLTEGQDIPPVEPPVTPPVTPPADGEPTTPTDGETTPPGPTEEADNTMLYAGIIIVIIALGGAYLFFTKK